MSSHRISHADLPILSAAQNHTKRARATPTASRASRSTTATMTVLASLLSPSPVLTTAASPSSSPTSQPPAHAVRLPARPLTATLAAAAAASLLLLSPATPPPSHADPEFKVYYGTAASAANYGGYGGNASKKDAAEYMYEVPEGWKERLVSKVEKGTNGTDSEFFNPRKRSEREYLTFLAGFRALAPVNTVLDNLALSDVGLQDQIASADDVRSTERTDGSGQVYYEYEIAGAGAHSLISVTCTRNKLYAHFVTAPNPEWGRDDAVLRRLHQSFKTIDPAGPPAAGAS